MKFSDYEHFYSPIQAGALKELFQDSEEGHAMNEVVDRVHGIIDNMPKTYETVDPKLAAALELVGADPDDPICFLHYFIGGCDWYIIEKDMDGDIDQAFGYACLNDPQNAELGYISIREVTQVGAELDLYFKPRLLSQVKRELAERYS